MQNRASGWPSNSVENGRDVMRTHSHRRKDDLKKPLEFVVGGGPLASVKADLYVENLFSE